MTTTNPMRVSISTCLKCAVKDYTSSWSYPARLMPVLQSPLCTSNIHLICHSIVSIVKLTRLTLMYLMLYYRGNSISRANKMTFRNPQTDSELLVAAIEEAKIGLSEGGYRLGRCSRAIIKSSRGGIIGGCKTMIRSNTLKSTACAMPEESVPFAG